MLYMTEDSEKVKLEDFDNDKISNLKKEVKQILQKHGSTYNYKLKGRRSDEEQHIDWDDIGFTPGSGEKALKCLRDVWEEEGKIKVVDEDAPNNPLVTRKKWKPTSKL